LSLVEVHTSFSTEHVDRGDWVGDNDVSATNPEASRARELERRIEKLEADDDAAFGHFTRWDWIVCTVFGLALPLLAVFWWAAI
jgi:hypothetical protein